MDPLFIFPLTQQRSSWALCPGRNESTIQNKLLGGYDGHQPQPSNLDREAHSEGAQGTP